MRIADVIRRKGPEVLTIPADAPVRDLLAILAEHGIGALVVSDDGTGVEGIVSERDVVRRLHTHAAALLDSPVASIMTREVRTCRPEDSVEDLMAVMTEHRIRHVPVVVEGRLVGIVSIGDVVKHRLAEVQAERDHLSAYVQG